MCDSDSHIMIEQLATSLTLSTVSVDAILTKHLGMSKVCSRWVPHLLNQPQKKTRVRIAKKLLEKYDQCDERRLFEICTDDEMWIRYSEPTRKGQNKEVFSMVCSSRTFLIRFLTNGISILCMLFRKKIVIDMESETSSIIELHVVGKRPSEIFKLLNIAKGRRAFIYRMIKRYKKTGDTREAETESSMLCNDPALKKGMRERIRQNIHRSMRKMALELNISRRAIQEVVQRDQGMHSFKRKMYNSYLGW
ncbi:Histone-lysine N-methyltransferase SETMAR-like [Oopsacas minuta]|uniref:Histone-lysine N-methyltransferase SETMAR-like n=1 Tax=Oopsacas minuta TaxID=111878 RepID=A0AAV7KR47_9METZ|nr:Histone-lysine N-methyltransferase SETMAR-like [Oopsacas minuta]